MVQDTSGLNAMLEIVEDQLVQNYPREVGLTLDRLRDEGYSRDKAVQLIGCALSIEMMEMMKHDQKFNERRYWMNLERLPKLPWEFP